MRTFSFLILVLWVSVVHGQSFTTENVMTLEDADAPAASLADIAWLEGYWTGEFLGGTFEEIWSAPSAGTMMGSFKLIRDEAVVFYELMIIREDSGTLFLSLKHFHDNLNGWEEKDEVIRWPLVKIDGERVYFDGLTFERIDEDHIRIYLAMKFGDKPVEEQTTVYNRLKS